jgi:hypothetical protein
MSSDASFVHLIIMNYEVLNIHAGSLDDRRSIHGENGKIKHFGIITVFFHVSVLLFIVFLS